MIVFDKRSPVYEKIIAYFKAEIASHRMEAGQEMPIDVELPMLAPRW